MLRVNYEFLARREYEMIFNKDGDLQLRIKINEKVFTKYRSKVSPLFIYVHVIGSRIERKKPYSRNKMLQQYISAYNIP